MMSQVSLDNFIQKFPDWDLYKKLKYRTIRVYIRSESGKIRKWTGQLTSYGTARINLTFQNGNIYRFHHGNIISLEVIK